MALLPVVELMRDALDGGYAIGYFESWNLESLQGTLDAAEEAASPIIIGFNGDFMSHPGRTTLERMALYGALGKAAAETTRLPVGFIFNECKQLDWVEAAASAGFNLIMPISDDEESSEFVQQVKAICELAHSKGVAVETELGILPCDLPDDEWAEEGGFTDPDHAAAFVKETGVDLLAVSCGNAHISLSDKQTLDIDHIKKVFEAVQIPLVLHGGTGIEDESLVAAIQCGVAKVNYGTVLKQAYLKAIREALGTDEVNPHKLLGYGGDEDVMNAGRLAVKQAVLEKFDLLGTRWKG